MGVLQVSCDILFSIGSDADEFGNPTSLVDEGGEDRAVAIANLARLERPIDRHNLVAGGQDSDPWARMDENPGVAEGSEKPKMSRSENGSWFEDDGSGEDVFTRVAHIFSRGDFSPNTDDTT
jgi:hypothetical protein